MPARLQIFSSLSLPELTANLMNNLLDIESLLKQGNYPINVFTDNLIKLS